MNTPESSSKIMEERMKAKDKKNPEVNSKKKYEKPEIKKHRSVSIISGSCSYYSPSVSFGTYYYWAEDGSRKAIRNIFVTFDFLFFCVRNSCSVRNIMAKYSTLNELVMAAPDPVSRTLTGSINETAIEMVAKFFSWLFPSIKSRKCLYRSLLILYWSKKFGLSPLLNVGLEFSEKVQGHAWLTVNNQPFCDSSRLYSRYPNNLATQGPVRFWCGTWSL